MKSLLIKFKNNDIERVLATCAILIVLVSTLFDVFDDVAGGDTLAEILVDIAIGGSMLFVLIYIWRLRPHYKNEENKNLHRMVHASNKDLDIWKSKASRLLEGLGAQIDEQFDLWGLTKAEKEVSILLIKGMSFKEIAELRHRSEKTIRQQATSVYAKSNLENRAVLSAFFLEDLLLPNS